MKSAYFFYAGSLLLKPKYLLMKARTYKTPVINILIFTVVLLGASCKKTTSSAQPAGPDPVSVADPAYDLVWSDEFNGNAIDLSKWTFDNGAAQNNEKEYYQPANAAVSGGSLVITAKKESAGGLPYTSSRLNTSGKFSVQYGKIEARLKIPAGQGLWPAFWMLGQNFKSVGWPFCGEIDIMEHVNSDNLFYGTIHWDNNGHAQYGKSTTAAPADYHIYAIEWDASSIKWYVDNVLYNTADIKDNINGTDEFHKPFFIILNLAVGGDWPGQTIDETKLPAALSVDYVRVYKKK